MLPLCAPKPLTRGVGSGATALWPKQSSVASDENTVSAAQMASEGKTGAGQYFTPRRYVPALEARPEAEPASGFELGPIGGALRKALESSLFASSFKRFTTYARKAEQRGYAVDSFCLETEQGTRRWFASVGWSYGK